MQFSEFESSNLFWHHVLAKAVLAKRLRFIVQSDSPDLLKGQSIILRSVRLEKVLSLSTSSQVATAVSERLSFLSEICWVGPGQRWEMGQSDRETTSSLGQWRMMEERTEEKSEMLLRARKSSCSS